MKKRLLAIFLAAAMVVCLMPTMAFATGEPAPAGEQKIEAQNNAPAEEPEVQEPTEEPKEELVEAPATEEAAPETSLQVVEEEKAEAKEDKAEPESTTPELAGAWDGYKYTVTTPVEGKKLSAYMITEQGAATILENIDGSDSEIKKAVTDNVNRYDIDAGVMDFTAEVNNVFANGAAMCFIVITENGNIARQLDAMTYNDKDADGKDREYNDKGTLLDEYVNVSAFFKFDKVVKVDTAAKKDTTFTYEISSLVATEGKTTNELVTMVEDNMKARSITNPKVEDLKVEDITNLNIKLDRVQDVNAYAQSLKDLGLKAGIRLNAGLVDNTVVLKKGNKVAEDYLVYRMDAEISSAQTVMETVDKNFKKTDVDYLKANFKIQLPLGLVFSEKKNNGGYTTDKSVFVGSIPFGDIVKSVKECIIKDSAKDSALQRVEIKVDTKKLGGVVRNVKFKFAKFKNMAALDAKLAEINASGKNIGERLTSFESLFTAEAMVDTAAAHKLKGVNTGDSNELGLWLALGALASVACAAYALKRREN